ncbi:hypothetical protein JCM8547_007772 [Rhodosporidiobolus lusitaniae]
MPMDLPKKALSSSQEAKLIRYLDAELHKLSGNYESRHSVNSPLQSLSDFLDALHPLLSFILSIPAAPPSSDIRVAYLLQLTGYIPPALDGYPVLDSAVPALFFTLSRFDAGWVAVLRGQDWDSSTGAPHPLPPGSPAGGAVRTTDRVRLESLIKSTKGVLAIALGLPEFVPLEEDPFLLLRKQMEVRREEERIREEEKKVKERERERKRSRRAEGEEEDEGEVEMRDEGATPSLVSDSGAEEDDAMAVDTDVSAVATPSAASLDMEEEEGSDDEFEEVALPPSCTSLLTSTATSGTSTPFAYADSPSADGSFSIHFPGPPPPTLTDGEFSLGDGETPIVGQARGFDPDAEYPPEEEEGEEGGEEEDGVGEEVREKVRRVFEGAERVLGELRAAAA